MKLETVLEYHNQTVINRFSKKNGYDIDESTFIFKEMLKWLFLINKALELKKGTNTFLPTISSHLYIIDEMWHNFILCTRDYHNFCLTYFKRFIHHQPMSLEEWTNVNDSDKKSSNELIEQHFREQLYFVKEHLGEPTLKLWYKEFPKKYA